MKLFFLKNILIHVGPNLGSNHLGLLVQEAQEGKESAMNQLVQQFGDDLWSFIHFRIKPPLAEDVYQTTWVKIFQKLGSLRDPNKFKGWAFAIGLNTLRAMIKSREISGFEWDQKQSETLNPDDALCRRDRKQILLKVLADLHEEEQDILMLDLIHQIPQKEIADMLGMNLNTLKTRIRRLKIKLTEKILEAGHDV